MGYLDNYANNVANIYAERARMESQATLQKGAAWANAFQQIGQSVAAIPGQMKQQKAEDARLKSQSLSDDVTKTNLARLRRVEAEDTLLSNVYQQALNPQTGELDEKRFRQIGTEYGLGAGMDEAVKTYYTTKAAKVQLDNLMMSGRATKMELDKANREYLRSFALPAVQSSFNPVVMNGLYTVAKDLHKDEPEVLAAINQEQQSMMNDPLAFAKRMNAIVYPQKTLETTNLGPGAQLIGQAYDESNAPIPGKTTVLATGAPKPMSVDEQMAEAVRTKNAPEIQRLRGIMGGNAAATRAPEKDSFTSERVLTQDGTVAPAIFNSRTGQFYDPQTRQLMPNAMKVSDSGVTALENKGKLAAIVSRMNELSEKINTSEGVVATAKGAAAQQAAKVNLDNDVAEYEALVSVYTPIVARANGHTGVLTQIDVDSTKAGFPGPRDSKSLRDRKVDIMTTIQGAGNLTGKPNPASVPQNVSDALKGQKDGSYTLSDGSKWSVVNGVVKGGG